MTKEGETFKAEKEAPKKEKKVTAKKEVRKTPEKKSFTATKNFIRGGRHYNKGDVVAKEQYLIDNGFIS